MSAAEGMAYRVAVHPVEDAVEHGLYELAKQAQVDLPCTLLTAFSVFAVRYNRTCFYSKTI